MGKKSKIQKKKKNQNVDKKRKWMLGILMLLLLPIIVGIIFSTIPTMQEKRVTGPKFQKDGELQFIDSLNQQNIRSIDIEIADNDLERSQGLMYRKSMEENQGMLFIMEKEELQSFWMLNTEIPLDMIFVDQNLTIVSIQKDIMPRSLEPTSSVYPAKYVVEVIAGFSNKHGLKEGQKIQFQRD